MNSTIIPTNTIMMVDQNNPHNIDGHNKENLYKYNSFPENEQTSVSHEPL